MDNHIIIIEVEGGVVQDVIGVPKGITVQINDYDTEGADQDELTELQDGTKAIVSEYEGFSERVPVAIQKAAV